MAEDAALDVDLLAASLRADATDLGQFAELLADKLTAALPARASVERRRTGLMGPKRVRRIVVRLDAEQLELHAGEGTIEALRAHVSGGIALKHERLEIDAWLVELSAALASEAGRSERTRLALERWLT